jgi:hypothetical protein
LRGAVILRARFKGILDRKLNIQVTAELKLEKMRVPAAAIHLKIGRLSAAF